MENLLPPKPAMAMAIVFPRFEGVRRAMADGYRALSRWGAARQFGYRPIGHRRHPY